MKTLGKVSKISQDELSHEIKIATDFNVNSMRRKNKVLVLKNHYTVYSSSIV